MIFIHLTMAILASFRLIELFASDKITEPLRKRYPHYLWQCHRCLSVWAGIAVTVLFVVFPWANWPFALSWVYFIHNDVIFMRGRRLVAVFDPAGNGKILKQELNHAEVSNMCAKILAKQDDPKANV